MNTSSLVAETIWKDIESTRSVNEDQLSILHFLFGKNLERATRIADQRGVKRISASGCMIYKNWVEIQWNLANQLRNLNTPSSCSFSKIRFGKRDSPDKIIDFILKRIKLGSCSFDLGYGGISGKEEYFCFPEHYCACYSFFYDIVNRGEQLCCKHQLAARLATSLGACVDEKVSDEQLALLLSKL